MLTAVILYYKNWPTIVTTITRLLSQLPAGAELVLVDNASGDGAVAKMQPQFPDVHFIVRETNSGYAAGMNDGLRAASRFGSKYALLMTHECLLETGAIELLLQELENNETTALAGPMLIAQEAPVRIFSAGGQLKGRALVPEHIGPKAGYGKGAISTTYDVDWVDGACMMLRLDAAIDVGMMDERFFLYVEEVEFALRLRRTGRRVVCVAEAKASQSTGGIPAYYEARNQVLLSRVHGLHGAFVLATLRQLRRILQDYRHGRTAVARQRIFGLIDFYRGKTGQQ